jgi:hypothetical protein
MAECSPPFRIKVVRHRQQHAELLSVTVTPWLICQRIGEKQLAVYGRKMQAEVIYVP